jgi:hypothetical protein
MLNNFLLLFIFDEFLSPPTDLFSETFEDSCKFIVLVENEAWVCLRIFE